MVKFLIDRPVAVVMSFIAVLMLGVVSSGRLPVSLMPDIDIPEITVAVSRSNNSAREIENSVVSILRRNLLQVPGLDDIESESRNGSALILLKFEYGTDIDMAFMEVNEKIDGSMNSLPPDIERPRIIKASATDIPVFFLNLSLNDQQYGEEKFIELSKFSETVIKKRIEQLPEVAIADITGQIKEEIYIEPDPEKCSSLGVTENNIRQAIERNNINVGSILVKDGKYLYNLEFSSYLREVNDVKNIYLKAGEKLVQLKEVADIGIQQQRSTGNYFNGNKKAITLAIIKKATARMADMEENLGTLLDLFALDYPDIEFEISQDQTRILDFSMSNLKKSLMLGGSLAFLIMFFFLRDGKAPWLIGLSIPTSVLISILLFHLVGLSINIISLSGLILGVGMMIDNSIIVIDNITQYRARGSTVYDACIEGTNEVIRPLLSSMLTTCAVFIPLIFLSGIAGALFYDQAIAISIGLLVSFLVSITLLPALYRQLYKKEKEGWLTRFVMKISFKNLEEKYEGGMRFFFRYKYITMAVFLLLIGVSVLMFSVTDKERLPSVSQDELVVEIDWNENIDMMENNARIMEVLTKFTDYIKQSNSFIGEQDFIFNRDYDQTYTQARIYIKSESFDSFELMNEELGEFVAGGWPEATVNILPQENIFEKIFSATEASLVVRLSLLNEKQVPPLAKITEIRSELVAGWPDADTDMPPYGEKIMVKLDQEKMMLYNVSPTALYSRLKTAFNSNRSGELRTSHEILPIVMVEDQQYISNIISESFVTNSKGEDIPVRSLVKVQRIHGYKTIKGGVYGEYVPLNMEISSRSPEKEIDRIRTVVTDHNNINVRFGGSIISGQEIFKEMIAIILISVLLLYFILASQFESLTLPLIVLLELPIDIAGALLMLKLFGGTVNLMSMIGIIVMSGIIINDSILKIDTINRLRWAGMEIKEAIYTGGARRLKPIIMTSLTTILAMTPFLFGHDLGSELQQPLALTVIGGMALGTVVSLYFIPLAYWFLYRSKEQRAKS
ncbi:MAG: efflux RND transporter permease subunit [Bacteroidales bacterium]|nr:efflux RND transporter permease subunit [Bacteroidales bacterium]